MSVWKVALSATHTPYVPICLDGTTVSVGAVSMTTALTCPTAAPVWVGHAYIITSCHLILSSSVPLSLSYSSCTLISLPSNSNSSKTTSSLIFFISVYHIPHSIPPSIHNASALSFPFPLLLPLSLFALFSILSVNERLVYIRVVSFFPSFLSKSICLFALESGKREMGNGGQNGKVDEGTVV